MVGEDEILTAVEVPVLAAGTGSSYLKFEHPASGYAVVGAAAVHNVLKGWVSQPNGEETIQDKSEM